MTLARRLPRVSIRWVLLGAHAGTLLAPLLFVIGFRAYDVVLMRETEEKLAAEAVVIGETWRSALLAEGVPLSDHILPLGQRESLSPWEPQISLSTPVGNPLPLGEFPLGKRENTAEVRAGAQVQPILQRARSFNLSGARILDGDGVVVASSDGRDQGTSLRAVPEVQQALAGHYGVATRRRVPHGPLPPLDSMSRRGRVHVFVAIPIFADGRVIGVVRLARTSVSTLEHLWKNRRGFLVLLAISVTCAVTLNFLAYRAVAGPVRALRRKARAVSHHGSHAPITLDGWAPTEIEALRESLDQMRQQLSARADYVAQFAANATHELRTPLTAIRGATELLRESWPVMSDEQRERFLANVQGDTERMERLVRSLLTLARVENPRTTTTNVDVRAFFQRLAGAYQSHPDNHPAITFDVDAIPATLAIDEDHLASAIRNLIDNARRHGTHVRVRADTAGEQLRVEVTDDGPGVAAEHQVHLFKRFYTTERDRGGTGLGLAIVKAVAEGRGGHVTCTSRPGATTFWLVL